MHQGKRKVVIVVTSHSQLGDTGKKTGFHLEELAIPYLAFKKAGAEIVIASPEGGRAPVDPKSAKKDSPELQEFREDLEAQRKLENTVLISDVIEDVDVLFFPGGHGPMWDLATSEDVKDLVEAVWRDGGIVAALCHGPAALLNALDDDGHPIVRGKRINSFTDAEERAAGFYDDVPFHLEARLRELGAKFESSANGAAHVVRDGWLITGQNPASAGPVAQEVLRALELQDQGKAAQENTAAQIAAMRNEGGGMGNLGRVSPAPEAEDDALPAGLSRDRRARKRGAEERTMNDGGRLMSEGVGRMTNGEPAPGEPDEEAQRGGRDASRRVADATREGTAMFQGNRMSEVSQLGGELQRKEEEDMGNKTFGGSPEIDINRSTSAEEDRKLKAEQREQTDRSQRQELDDSSKVSAQKDRLLHEDRMSQDKKNKIARPKAGGKAQGLPRKKDNVELDPAHMRQDDEEAPGKQNPPRRR